MKLPMATIPAVLFLGLASTEVVSSLPVKTISNSTTLVAKNGINRVRQEMEDGTIPTLSEFSIEKPHLPELHPLLGEIQSYRTMPPNWDGYDGIPVHEQVIKDACKFLELFPFNYGDRPIALPLPAPSGDGEMGLYWKNDTAFAEVSFNGNGKISFFASKGTHELDSFDDMDIPQSRNLLLDRIANVVAGAFS